MVSSPRSLASLTTQSAESNAPINAHVSFGVRSLLWRTRLTWHADFADVEGQLAVIVHVEE